MRIPISVWSYHNDFEIRGLENRLVNISNSRLEDGSFGALVPRCNGFLSAFGCILMIYLILKSSTKLSSTYHRIMFCVALNGLVTSIAIGCTYWLFPQDDELLGWPYFVKENVNRLGNTQSCQIQGAIVISGYYIFEVYIASLCVYFLCALVFRMKPETISKWVEWSLHLFPFLIGAVPAIFGLKTGSFNPGDTTPWCAFRRYPAACPTNCWAPDDEGCACIRGSPKYDDIYYKYVYSSALYFFFTLIFTSLFAIFVRTCYAVNTLASTVRIRSSVRSSATGHDVELDEDLRFRVRNHKETLCHASLYASIMILIFISLLLTKSVSPDTNIYEVVKGFRIFAVSIQGAVFCAIYVFIKIRNLMTVDSDLTLWRALKKLLREPPDDVILLNLDVILREHEFRSSCTFTHARPVQSKSHSVASAELHFRSEMSEDLDGFIIDSQISSDQVEST